MIRLEITRATVITSRYGTDKVMLHTSLPEACWPFNAELVIEFNAASSTGKHYVENHWPSLPIQIIHINPDPDTAGEVTATA